MATKQLTFSWNSSSSPDFDSLKQRLSALRGVTEMDIHSADNGLVVDFDERLSSAQEIVNTLEEIGYRPNDGR